MACFLANCGVVLGMVVWSYGGLDSFLWRFVVVITKDCVAAIVFHDPRGEVFRGGRGYR